MKYIKFEDCYCDGKKVGEIGVYETDFLPKKTSILASPDSHGWTKKMLDDCLAGQLITPAEHASAKAKATK